MDSASVIALIAGACVAGYVALRVYDSPGVRRWREIRRAKLCSIADLPENVIGRIVGTVRASGPTEPAPINGRDCVYYAVHAFARTRTTRDHELIPLPRCGAVSTRTFELEDGTGVATIDPASAISQLGPRAYSPSDAEVEAYLRKHNALDDRVARIDEHIIAPGDEIAVIGFGQRGKDGSLRMSSSTHFPLILVRHGHATRRTLPTARVREPGA